MTPVAPVVHMSKISVASGVEAGGMMLPSQL